MHEFAKPLKTFSQVFQSGDPVGAEDNLLPHDFSDLVKRGFIREIPVAPTKKGAQPSGAPLESAT